MFIQKMILAYVSNPDFRGIAHHNELEIMILFQFYFCCIYVQSEICKKILSNISVSKNPLKM